MNVFSDFSQKSFYTYRLQYLIFEFFIDIFLFVELFELQSPINHWQTNTYQPICSLHKAQNFLIIVVDSAVLFGVGCLFCCRLYDSKRQMLTLSHILIRIVKVAPLNISLTNTQRFSFAFLCHSFVHSTHKRNMHKYIHKAKGSSTDFVIISGKKKKHGTYLKTYVSPFLFLSLSLP